jgi:hypothetical protein
MPRPRMDEKEFQAWQAFKDSEFVVEQLSLLKQECDQAGIPMKDVKHYWYKSKKFSLFAKNKIHSYEEVRDQIVKEMDSHSPVYEPIVRESVPNPHLLVIDPSDIHIGKLAVASETGEDYNIKKAIKRAKEGVQGVLNYSKGFNVDKILFVIGNDALHVDHPHRKTTAGTPQDTDGMWHTAFHSAKDMYIDLIEMLIPLADVHVLYCPSNHDYTHGYFLADTLGSWFRNSENVTFDINIRHRKYFKYGNNMIEADHGDGCKVKDTPQLMAYEASQMWAECDYRYSYKHHLHHKIKLGSVVEMGVDAIGVNIEFLRSPSASDGWHDRNGFKSMKSVEAFVHCKNRGRVASLSYNYEV